MENEYELEQERQPADIDAIIKFVTVGESNGLSAEQVLDPIELEAYQEFIENDRKEVSEHYDNLVPVLDRSELNMLAQDIINWVQWDEDTRDDWSRRESEGIRLLGVSDRKLNKALFEGASAIVHPLLAEAVVDFHSRIMPEIWPPEGPVKTQILGDSTPERLQQADRVQQYMNFQYTEDMPGAFCEEDQLLFRLPLSGSVFKKIYYDPLSDKLCSRMIEPADFIVPFSATDLESAHRYTHRYREMHNTVLKKIASGYYSKPQKLSEPNNEHYDYPVVKDEIDHTEGRQATGLGEDQRHTILEMYVDLELKGQEDLDEAGQPTGVALPYIVWVNRDDHEVMRIQRNWNPEDDKKQPEICFTHYRFMPGLGFYGYGLLHLIGGLSKSSTGALNALMDSAAFYNLQGGFRTRESRIRGDLRTPAPGEWVEVDSSSEELAKAFFPLPYKEPSETLFKLLGYLDERGQRFVGTTDVMQGDTASANAPVGTTLALIEQGSKKFGAIHRRIHVAHRQEFRILARMNSRYLPENGYPYYTNKGDRMIMPADFDQRIDIIPVSDPAITSSTQRIVQAQAIMDLAEKHPDQINMTEALRSMLEAIRIPNIDELMKVDGAMAQLQQQSLQLDVEVKQAQIAKLQAEKEKLDAEKTESALRGIFSAMQSAGMVVTTPSITPVADSIYLSAGGKDANQLPLAQQPAIQQQLPSPEQNTSPGFPATGNEPMPQQPMPEQTMPMSPEVGNNAGIETQTMTDNGMLQ
jgi:hypothetical protein